MSKEKNYLIEEYVNGKLIGEDLIKFEQELSQDPVLQALVEESFVERDVLETMAGNQIRRQIQEEYDLMDKSSSTGRNKYLSYILIAVLLLASFIFYKVMSGNETKDVTTGYAQEDKQEKDGQDQVTTVEVPEIIETPSSKEVTLPKVELPEVKLPIKVDFKKVVRALYIIPAALLSTRSEAGDDVYGKACKAFEEKKYSEVLNLLKTLPEDEEQEALSLRAHANFLLGYYQAAISDFQNLRSGGIYKRDGEWYGLLASIAVNGEKDQSWKKDLELILKNPNHPYYESAQKLESELK